jgi:hypothetical protein
MTLDILRKTGGWCVELQQPLKTHSGAVSAIEIRPPSADHVIRWGAYEIPSMLALLSELCGLSEKELRQLPATEFSRVMFAFNSVLPPTIDTKERLLATPEEQMPVSEQVPPPDQDDPRFPAAGGPVVRLAEKKPQPAPEEKPLDLSPPPITEAVVR